MLYKKIHDEILNQIQEWNEQDLSCIYNLTGSFGLGKSKVLSKLISNVKDNNLADALIIINNTSNLNFVSDYACLTALNFEFTDGKECSLPIETTLRKNRLDGALDKLEANSLSTYHSFLDLRQLRSFQSLSIDFENIINGEKDFRESDLSGIIESPFDQKLMTESCQFFTEALIIDILNYIYPFPEDGQYDLNEYLKAHNSPVKIVFALDDSDHILGSISRWIVEYLQNYIQNKKFSEFVSYDLATVASEVAVKDILDIRFIISSRNSYTKKYLSLVDKETNSKEFHLLPLEKDECKQFIQEQNVQLDRPFKDFNDICNGRGYLVKLWFEYIKLGQDSEDFNQIFVKAYNEICKYFDDDVKEWLNACVYLDSFNQNTLACIPNIGDMSEYAYKFFKESDDIITAKGDRLSVKQDIKNIIKKVIEYESKTLAIELEKLSENINKIETELKIIKEEDLPYIKNLAYFEKFDLNYAIDTAFKENADHVRNILKRYENLLVKNFQTYSLKKSTKDAMNQLNKLSDRHSIKNKVELINEIWKHRKEDLEKQLSEKKEKIKNIDDKLGKKKDDLNSCNEKLDKQEYEKSQYERSFNKIKNEIKIQSEKKNKIRIYSLYSVSFVSLILSTDLVIEFESSIFNYLFIAICLISAAYSSSLMFLKKDQEIVPDNEKAEELSKLELIIKEYKNIIFSLKDEKSDLELSINDFSNEKINIEKEIKNISEMLKESYT